MVRIQSIQILFVKQAKKTMMNCPAHISSKPPPLPIILATPLFKIIASPNVEENFELKYANWKKKECGFTAKRREDPGTERFIKKHICQEIGIILSG